MSDDGLKFSKEMTADFIETFLEFIEKYRVKHNLSVITIADIGYLLEEFDRYIFSKTKRI